MQTHKPVTQKERILERLERAGRDGVTNIELNNSMHIFRYGARIKELRDEGYKILSIKGKNKSEWLFRLVPEEKQASLF